MTDAATLPGRTIRLLAPLLLLAFLLLALAGCVQDDPNLFQGYVEGEFVYVAAPLAGRLDALSVDRGARVAVGAPLFALERDYEQAAVEDAAHKLRTAESVLADRRKGQRPTEMESLRASLRHAEAALALAEVEHRRKSDLVNKETISREEYDRAKTELDQTRERVRQGRADLATAGLGSRVDAVRAAEADADAARARLDQARWNLDQKAQAAQVSGLVQDTLYRRGEWVAAGRPVVSLLPPENVKVRFFVPQAVVGGLTQGQAVRVSFDGGDPVQARVSFISPQAEYTPPVIYSSQSRAKLVFLVEARVSGEDALRLHPGQPVDVRLEKAGGR